MPVLNRFFELLVEDGQCHILVPSLEWAAAQLVSEQPSPATMFHIYGAQWDRWQEHKTGFTMPSLRSVLNRAGFFIGKAVLAPLEITMTIKEEEQLIISHQLYVVGIKPTTEKEE